jgi:hypothetical protein
MDLSVACNLELGFPFPPVVSFPATPFPDLLSPENSYQRLSVSSATIMISTLLTMPLKKKGPRKKAKADKKHEDKKAVTVVAINSQMQRLKINKAVLDDDDAFLEEAIQLAAAEEEELKALEKCRHGYSPRSSREHNYCDIFALTCARIQPVAIQIEWWNAVPCFLALDVVGRTIALQNVKHKTGYAIRRTVTFSLLQDLSLILSDSSSCV